MQKEDCRVGKAGGFCIEKSSSLRWRRLLIAFVMVAVLGFVEGATLSSFWARIHPSSWVTNLVQYGGMVAIGIMVYWGFRKMNELEASAAKWMRGGTGETVVGRIIAKLPNEFHVINDIQVPGQKANLDHVVVGPTGVYVLDAKNWRGLVSPDGKGELLLNGKPTAKPCIRQFVGRVMGIRDKVQVLAPGIDPFF